MEDFNSKYSGEQVEVLLDQVASGSAGGGGGGITVETDPVFSASPAAAITDEKIAEWDNKYSKPSGGIQSDDLAEEVRASLRNADAYKGTVIGVKANNTINMPNEGIVDLGTVGTYSKPSTGIPKSDLTPSVQTLLDKAGTAVQPVDLKDEVYIADFTIESLRDAIYNGTNVDCDVRRLVNAMNANKIILVREGEDSSYKGVYVLNGYAEDLLYFSITDVNGNIFWCEGTDYIFLQGIDAQSLRVRNWEDKQDTLKSGENIKTINGESIVGSGNITISGGNSSSKEVMETPVVMMDDALVITFANGPMLPNRVYVASSAINGIRDLSLASPEENYGEYSLHFFVGDIIDMFVFPDNFRWANGAVPLIDVNTSYELSIAAAKMNGEYIYKAVLTKF